MKEIKKAFTLIELVVAMATSSILLAMAGGIFYFVNRMAHNIRTESLNLSEAMDFRDQLENELFKYESITSNSLKITDDNDGVSSSFSLTPLNSSEVTYSFVKGETNDEDVYYFKVTTKSNTETATTKTIDSYENINSVVFCIDESNSNILTATIKYNDTDSIIYKHIFNKRTF